MSALVVTIEQQLLQYRMNHNAIALGVSGGIDSLSMLDAFILLSDKHFLSIHVVIVNHNMRPESKQEAADVAAHLQDRYGNSIRIAILHYEGMIGHSNRQKIARDRRYELLIEYCQRHDIKFLCTAHNYNDQAETILMRIMRGTGIRGLQGIKESFFLNSVQIIRPLLTISRDAIVEYMKNKNYPIVHDPSNENIHYTRTRCRQLLATVSEGENLLHGLCYLSQNAIRNQSYIDTMVRDFLKASVMIDDFAALYLDIIAFLQLHEEIALRVLSIITSYIAYGTHNHNSYISIYNFCHFKEAKLSKLIQLYRKVIQSHGQIKVTFNKCEIFSNKKAIIFIKELQYAPKDIILQGQKSMIWDQRFYIANNSTHDIRISPLKAKNLCKIRQENQGKKIPYAKILFSTPAIYDSQGEIIYSILDHKDPYIIRCELISDITYYKSI